MTGWAVVKSGRVRRPGVGARWRWVVAVLTVVTSTLLMEGVAAAEYSEQQRLTDSDPEQYAMFGTGVAVSGDGNTAIVGRTKAGRDESGVAKVFVRSGTTWTLQQVLSNPEPPITRTDWFGGTVALSADGNTAVVGAYADPLDFTYGASKAGSVTIFARSGTTWTQQAHLTCADSDPVCQFGASNWGTVNQAGFGYSVAVSGDGDTVMVGTKLSGSNNVAAVVFTRSGSTWTLQQSIALVGEYTSNHQVQEHKFHGMSVALSSDGNTAAVGDQDGASTADWMAVNGTYSGYSCNTSGNMVGAVRVLTRSGSTWTEQQTLVPTGGEARCGFGGYGLDLSDDGNTLIGGAGFATVGSNTSQGSATVFTRSGSTWTQQQTLNQAATSLYFGISVSLSDDAGTVINPLIFEGQQQGGIGQGISQALFEEVLFDEDGNPQTGNLMDYAFPSAAEMIDFETHHTVTPTHLNPLGAKGIGEASTIGSTPAVQNAVIDALAHLGVRHIDMPCTPERVWNTVQAAVEGILPDPWRDPPSIFDQLTESS